MTEPKLKRALLGFDGSSDDDVEEPSPPLKRARVPKLIFKPSTVGSDQATSTSTRVLSERNSNTSDIEEDYLTMKVEDEGKPASTEPQETETPDTMTRLKTSLFGEVTNYKPDDVMKPIITKSKGLKMMEKMGFKIGDTLGKNSQNKDAILEPILVVPKAKKSGVGYQDEQRVAGKGGKGITTEDEEEFKQRKKEEMRVSRLEGIVRKMQRYCFEFEDRDVVDIENVDLLDLNVMWRGYVKSIQEAIKRKRTEALEANTVDGHLQEISTEDIAEAEADEELEMFEEESVDLRLKRLNAHLRSDYAYCFFCGVKYEDQEDLHANCPGPTETDHE